MTIHLSSEQGSGEMGHGLTCLRFRWSWIPSQSPHCRPTGNSSAKLGGKVRNGSSGKSSTDKATGNWEAEARAERRLSWGSDKREACTRLFRYYAPQTTSLDTCWRTGRHVENHLNLLFEHCIPPPNFPQKPCLLQKTMSKFLGWHSRPSSLDPPNKTPKLPSHCCSPQSFKPTLMVGWRADPAPAHLCISLSTWNGLSSTIQSTSCFYNSVYISLTF